VDDIDRLQLHVLTLELVLTQVLANLFLMTPDPELAASDFRGYSRDAIKQAIATVPQYEPAATLIYEQFDRIAAAAGQTVARLSASKNRPPPPSP
jgi:hypothetical protein